jgi:hypothetical protein
LKELEELKTSYNGDEWAQNILTLYQQGGQLPTVVQIHYGIIRVNNRIYVGK